MLSQNHPIVADEYIHTSTFLITLHGTPTAIEKGGTSFVTTEPAPTTAPSRHHPPLAADDSGSLGTPPRVRCSPPSPYSILATYVFKSQNRFNILDIFFFLEIAFFIGGSHKFLNCIMNILLNIVIPNSMS